MTGPTTDPAPPAGLAAVRERFLEALLVPDARAAWVAVQEALDAGTPPGRVYLDVVGPAMERIGALWETARISVAEEHLATQITQSVLARLAPVLADGASPGPPGRVAVVAGTPGELHALGPRMVGDFLEAAGWDVLLVGPDPPAQELIDLVRERRPALVALSTALPANLPAAGSVFAALRRLEPAPLIVAGGRAYDGDTRRAELAGADVFAADPEALLAELALRLR